MKKKWKKPIFNEKNFKKWISKNKWEEKKKMKQNDELTACKNGHILLKMYFWSLISKVKATCMPVVSFILSFFNLNHFFFSSLVVAYAYIFPS